MWTKLARRFGVHPSTVEKGRQDALEGISVALRQGTRKARGNWSWKAAQKLERAFTDVAIKKELLERFLAERRPTVPGKWSK